MGVSFVYETVTPWYLSPNLPRMLSLTSMTTTKPVQPNRLIRGSIVEHKPSIRFSSDSNAGIILRCSCHFEIFNPYYVRDIDWPIWLIMSVCPYASSTG